MNAGDKQMATEKQIAANRANAAKSTGPKSKRGRDSSSGNSLRHGLLAETVIVEGESHSRFTDLSQSLHDEYLPQTPGESALIETMVVARWRLMRLWAIEQACMTREIRTQHSLDPDSATQAAQAFSTLSDSTRTLDLIHRYETRYDRQYSRALNSLLRLREKSGFAKRTQLNPPNQQKGNEKAIPKPI
jgi:hypothetical protein